ncbi:MAG: primosomal protein N' [Planctomycetes bacterium]|nr:primosomal protein N' [Planctomycetota bacterium]
MSKQQQSLFAPEEAPWEADDAAQYQAAMVVLSEAPWGPYDYRTPERLRGQVEPGRRVRVPLGRGNRTVVGYCVAVENRLGDPSRFKEIRAVMDGEPLLTPAMLEVTRWMAEHYLCPLGQVLDAVVPAGVRGRAGTREVTFLHVPTEVAARLATLDLPEKQAAALTRLAASDRPLTPHQLAEAAGCTLGPITALRKKGYLKAQIRRVQHTEVAEAPVEAEEHHSMTGDQQRALDATLGAMHAGRHETILIHGVTGSGKTEVYIRAIEETIRFGKQAIVLVPEISLTPQTRQRFRSRFQSVALLHSHLSAPERHWHWQRIVRGEVQVVVGARSAVFAPTPRLGLIILDEEHDGSFKQDSAPRYHARDVALRRAAMERAPLVLGSATPSLESWRRAQQGEYRLLEMPRRVFDRPLPDVAALDLRAEWDSRRSRGAISRQLQLAMEQALNDGGQVILLLNRRGFSTHIQCPQCGHVVRCQDCDIALTHHREAGQAICHYCDYQTPAPQRCPECGFDGIRYSGLGTERLEAEVRARFSDVPCLRMDSDTMQKPGSHEAALARFRAGEVRILLGTQMIAKGLDFPNVTLVGVVNADTALHLPDFRAAERTFQLVTQVAGRTGRGEKGGRVLVQTFSPEHPAILAAMRHDYEMFARNELPNREEYGYPPFSSMVRVVVRGPVETVAEGFSDSLAERLTRANESRGEPARVLGPSPAPIAKLRGKHRFHMLLIAPDVDVLRTLVQEATKDLKPPEDVQWTVDVDPLDML